MHVRPDYSSRRGRGDEVHAGVGQAGELGDLAAAKQALREVSAELARVADHVRHCAAKDTRVHKLERGGPKGPGGR